LSPVMCPVDVRCRRLIWGSLGTNLSERLRSGVDPVCSSSVIWRFACTTRMRHNITHRYAEFVATLAKGLPSTIAFIWLSVRSVVAIGRPIAFVRAPASDGTRSSSHAPGATRAAARSSGFFGIGRLSCHAASRRGRNDVRTSRFSPVWPAGTRSSGRLPRCAARASRTFAHLRWPRRARAGGCSSARASAPTRAASLQRAHEVRTRLDLALLAVELERHAQRLVPSRPAASRLLRRSATHGSLARRRDRAPVSVTGILGGQRGVCVAGVKRVGAIRRAR